VREKIGEGREKERGGKFLAGLPPLGRTPTLVGHGRHRQRRKWVFLGDFFDTHTVEYSFSLWVSKNPSSFIIWVDFSEGFWEQFLWVNRMNREVNF
jgi:hypothetical protein